MPRNDDRPGVLGWLFRLFLILLIVGGAGFLAYAYVGDLSVAPQPVSVPVPLGG